MEQAGADVNWAHPEAVTPLMYAAAAGHVAVARYLLDQGAGESESGGARKFLSSSVVSCCAMLYHLAVFGVSL